MRIFHQKQKPPRVVILAVKMVIVAAIGFIMGCSAPYTTCENEKISLADSLIWTHPDSSRRILEGLDTTFFSEKDKMYWHLVHEHALFRLTQHTSSDSVLLKCANYFASHNLKRYACEAFYVRGASLFATMQYNDAVQSLKEAETYIPYLDSSQPYAGMIYLTIGRCLETDFLYHIAKEYYQKALSCFEEVGDHLRLYACYRDLGRTTSLIQTDNDSISYYFDKAIEEARLLDDTFYIYESLIQKEITSHLRDSDFVFELCSYVLDSLHISYYVEIIAEHYIVSNEPEKAEYYIRLMEQDTLLSDWHKRNYHRIQSLYLASIGNYVGAYNEMCTLYNQQLHQIREDARVRTFAIAQRYDLEREQEKTLKLTIERQRTWIIAGVILIILLIITITCAWIIIQQLREAKRKQQEIAMQQAQLQLSGQEMQQREVHIRLLEEEQLHQQARFRELFIEHMTWYKELLNENYNSPKWLQQQIEAHNLTSAEQWQQFEKDFQTAYGDIIDYIKTNHPSLSKQDEQYLMLRIIGLRSRDMVSIIGKSSHTLWNRKHMLLKRLKTNDLNEWVRTTVLAYNRMVATSKAQKEEADKLHLCSNETGKSEK